MQESCWVEQHGLNEDESQLFTSKRRRLTPAVDVAGVKPVVIRLHRWGSRRQLVRPLAKVFHPGHFAARGGAHALAVARLQVPLDECGDAGLTTGPRGFHDTQATESPSRQESFLLLLILLVKFEAAAVDEPLHDLHVPVRRGNPERRAVVDGFVLDNALVICVEHLSNVEPSLHAGHVERRSTVVARNMEIGSWIFGRRRSFESRLVG